MAETKQTRLDSWGEIAQYLRCDETTAWRWEKNRGLPVHRLPGGRRNAVFAYSDEIDAWLRSDQNGHCHVQGRQSNSPNGALANRNGSSVVPGGGAAAQAAPAPIEEQEGYEEQDKPVFHETPASIGSPVSVASGSLDRTRKEREVPWLFPILAIFVFGTLLITSHVDPDRTPRSSGIPMTAQAEAWPDPRLTQYDFEEGEQGWVVRPHMMISKVFSSTTHAWQGKRSLAIVFDNPYARKSQIYVSNPPISAGQSITGHVWCPAKNQLKSISLYAEDGEHTWSNDWHAVATLIPGAWNKFVLRLPADAVVPMSRLGLEFTADSTWQGTCYLDTVDW